MKNNIFGVLGLILLVPILMAVPSYVSTIKSVIEAFALSSADPKNIAGIISAQIVHQIQVLIVLIPGIIICSVTILKLKFNPAWHSYAIKVYVIILFLMLPILLLLGIYLFLLSRKQGLKYKA
jgi:hypothetical protein